MARSSALRPRELLSQQVSGSRYFFLELGPGAAGGCRLALGGRERCNPDYAIDRRSYAYHVLEYVAEGEGEVVLGERRGALGPGSVFAYAPRTHLVIRNNPSSPMLKYFFCLAGPGVAARLARAGLAPGRVRRLEAHGEIRSVAEDIVREGQRSGRLLRPICQALLELLLLKLADGASWSAHAHSGARENFLRAKAHLDAHAESLATLEDAAAAVSLDVSTLCRLFRRFQGSSPYQYLLRRKMNLAAEFLVESGGLVKEAAQRVGFSDPYHFSRCFRSVHGIPPSRLLHRLPVA